MGTAYPVRDAQPDRSVGGRARSTPSRRYVRATGRGDSVTPGHGYGCSTARPVRRRMRTSPTTRTTRRPGRRDHADRAAAGQHAVQDRRRDGVTTADRRRLPAVVQQSCSRRPTWHRRQVGTFDAGGAYLAANLSWKIPATTDLDQVIVRRNAGSTVPTLDHRVAGLRGDGSAVKNTGSAQG